MLSDTVTGNPACVSQTWAQCENNLRNVDVEIPLGKFVALTGVSGSGKSTLLLNTLYPALMRALYNSKIESGAHDVITGMENIDKVVDILFEGSPLEKEPIPEEEGMDIPDRYVLGGRVDFIRRGHNTFTIYPLRPIPIEGITKTISIWVAGRNFNHELKIMIQDFFGRDYELFVGKLNFQGWKKLTVAIPPQPLDGNSGIVQRNYHYNNNMGIAITGFKVLCDPMESFGNYYIYLDDLRAVTDLFAENDRDPDDMVDSW